MNKLIKIFFSVIFTFSIFFLFSTKASEKIKIGLMVPLTGSNKELGKSIIKAVRLALKDINNNAIYFSRNTIPFNAVPNLNVGKQVCVIPFKAEFLKLYSNFKETPLEKVESIDMLRIIENGFKVRMVNVKGYFQPVDVLEDVELVERFLLKKIKT